MPDGNAALGAARFEITIDGHSLGRFEMVLGVVASGAAPRSLQVHELPLLLKRAGGSQSDRVISWEKTQELRSGKVTLWDHAFELPHKNVTPPPSAGPQSSRKPHRIVDITLKRGVCSQALISRWEALGARDVVLVGLGPTGQPVARCTLTQALPVKIGGPTLHGKGSGEVAIEEIVIAHEGIRLD